MHACQTTPLRVVIAEDSDGQRRLDVIADPNAPDRFRVVANLWIPVDLSRSADVCGSGGDPGVPARELRARAPRLGFPSQS